MAATKSTLNSRLPKCGKPAIFTKLSEGISCTKAFSTGETGAFTATIGVKQPSKKNYSYQVQYRFHYRYTAATAKKKGANWTSWSSWMTPVAIAAKGSLPRIPANGTANPNTWLRSNVGVNTKVTYQKLVKFTDKTLGNYQAISMQFRIRTFDAAKAKHGDWVTSDSLVIFRKPTVMDEVLQMGEDGALDIDYNYQWDRACKLVVTSIKDSTDRQLLRGGAFSQAPQYDSLRSANTPCPLRSGYKAGTNTITPDRLKRAIQPNETLTYRGYLETGDGARTTLESPKVVYGEDAVLGPPRLVVTTNLAQGRAVLDVFKTDADDDLLSVGASVTWTYLGKEYSATPTSSTIDTTVISTTVRVARFWFSAKIPLGIPLTFKATFKNHYKKTKSTTETVTLDTGSVAYLNGLTNTSIVATAFGNMSLSLTSAGSFVTARPFGRALPFAAVDTTGMANRITFAADIADFATEVSQYATFAQWNSVRTNPGIYLLRMPDGQTYRVAVTEVAISQEREGLRRVTLTCEEVS